MNKITTDVDDPNFFSEIREEIEFDMARTKKSIVVINNLRVAASELEIETAALYHTQVWHDMEKLKTMNATKTQQSGDSSSSIHSPQ